MHIKCQMFFIVMWSAFWPLLNVWLLIELFYCFHFIGWFQVNWFPYQYISLCVRREMTQNLDPSNLWIWMDLIPCYCLPSHQNERTIVSSLTQQNSFTLWHSRFPALALSWHLAMCKLGRQCLLVYRVVNCFSESLHPTNVVIMVHREARASEKL